MNVEVQDNHNLHGIPTLKITINTEYNTDLILHAQTQDLVYILGLLIPLKIHPH